MSNSQMYYTDPQLSANIAVASQLISAKHYQLLKLADGRDGSIAPIPGDSSNGLFVQLYAGGNPLTKVPQANIFDGANDRLLPVGGVRNDALDAPEGSTEDSYTLPQFDSDLRLYTNSLKTSGLIAVGDKGTTRVAVKRAVVGLTHAGLGATTVVAGVTGKILRILGWVLGSSASVAFRFYSEGETLNPIIGTATHYGPRVLAGDTNSIYVEDGLGESLPSEGIVLATSAAATMGGVLIYAEVPVS